MSRPSTPGSVVSSTAAKDSKPAWCSPGRPRSNLINTAVKGKPLAELKSGHRGPNWDGRPVKAEKPLSVKKAPLQQDTPSALTEKTTVRASSPKVAVVNVHNPVPAVATPKTRTINASVIDETPPRSRPLKKALAVLVTPTNKPRKPLATLGTPKGSLAKGSSTKSSTPKSTTPKGITPIGRTREKSQATEHTPTRRVKETPTRRVKERPNAAPVVEAQEILKIGSKDKALQQPFSTWASSAAVRSRKGSPTPGRAPVKHLFLSPQGSKKNPKKEPLRKSIDNHRIWVGAVPPRNRSSAGEKREADFEMPPPAQPTNSPEIPKRNSREASGEGIRGYFGAGPMVAPDGMGFVRDRRKCKPRGTLMVGEEGLSMESDSSSVIESSIQMPLPSVASVEWMMNNGAAGNLNDVSRSPCKQTGSASLSDFTIRENQACESFQKERASQQVSSDGLQNLRKSGHNGAVYFQHAGRSQALLQLMRQSQFSREESISRGRLSQYDSGDGLLRNAEQSDLTDTDLEHEDSTIDWRQGLPCESMDMTCGRGSSIQEVGKNEEMVRSSVSFTSSWVPPPEESRRLSGNARSWYTSDSSWYGFSPITPEFQRNSQLPEGGSKAIDALVAGSVRRRIMPDQSTSSEKLATLSTSLAQSMPLVNANDSVSSRSAYSSQDTCSSFQFATRNSYASSSAIDEESIPLDTFVCQTASPIHQSLFGEDLLCQTASPINEVYDAACSVGGNLGRSIDCSVACSIDCSVEGSFGDLRDEAMESDEEMEYASPIMGDSLSPEKCPSPRCEEGATDLNSCVEVNMGARVSRRSSMSRTLEELMRHNFTL